MNPTDPNLTIAADDRVLIVAPHPDDETLAVGGLLQHAVASGAAIRLLFVTDGENNPWAQRAVEWRWPIGALDRARWGARRRREALSALEQLGVRAECVEYLEYPDQGLTDLLLKGGESLIETLSGEIARWRPTLLVLPAVPDAHPDHSAVAVLASFALARLGAFEHAPLTLSYVVHEHRLPPKGGVVVSLALTAAQREAKRRAILSHASQLKLRSRYVLSFARDVESFTLDADSRAKDESHPVWDAFIDRGELHVGVAPLPRFARGAPALMVAIEDSRRGRARMIFPLGRRIGEMVGRDLVSSARPPQARSARDRSGMRLEIPLPSLALDSSALAFVKLERPLERRWGFFDRAGWRLAPVLGVPAREEPSRVAAVMTGETVLDSR